MIKEITMPAGGQTTDTSMIGSWLVKQGDQVKRGDALLEVETDKATLTVESFAKGTVLALLAEPGDARSAGEVIALIGDESDMAEVQARLNGDARPEAEKSATAAPVRTEPEEDEYQPIDKAAPVRLVTPEQQPGAASLKNPGTISDNGGSKEVKAMPNAKKLAAEHNISIVEAAAWAGRDVVRRCDVEQYLESRNDGSKTTDDHAAYTEFPLTTIRRVIARRMLESAQTIPAFQATVEVDMESCIAFRGAVNGRKDAARISYNDILFKCVEAAIRKFPLVNSSYTDAAVLQHHHVNIGLAVSVDAGLVVPVVRGVEGKNILQISEDNRENIEKARSGELSPADMSGGTITLSNLGIYPITQFSAIINPPEVCILAIGAMEEKPVYIDGGFKVVRMMKITASFDHRVIDGAYGAAFLAELKMLIENPAMALL